MNQISNTYQETVKNKLCIIETKEDILEKIE